MTEENGYSELGDRSNSALNQSKDIPFFLQMESTLFILQFAPACFDFRVKLTAWKTVGSV